MIVLRPFSMDSFSAIICTSKSMLFRMQFSHLKEFIRSPQLLFLKVFQGRDICLFSLDIQLHSPEIYFQMQTLSGDCKLISFSQFILKLMKLSNGN